jgi:ribosome biogenesis GTPase A
MALDRAAAGEFNLVVLGEFKRGKSSLINALLGRAALPVGVVPLTSVATIIRYARSTAWAAS